MGPLDVHSGLVGNMLFLESVPQMLSGFAFVTLTSVLSWMTISASPPPKAHTHLTDTIFVYFQLGYISRPTVPGPILCLSHSSELIHCGVTSEFCPWRTILFPISPCPSHILAQMRCHLHPACEKLGLENLSVSLKITQDVGTTVRCGGTWQRSQ